ncbi:MAG: CYTH domain-containing protein [Deltaproteobacteria bacterium]|nr:CYTH domain-containing protein [Deltaproteobacteria bacterium]
MSMEIERKFLLCGEEWRAMTKGELYRQGYLGISPACSVRVRLAGQRAFLGVKGAGDGPVHEEYEYPIPLAEAEALLERMAEKPLIEKIRYKVLFDGLIWEVDEFLGENTGLILAEVELESETQKISKPSWIGVEVTGDPRYFNASLVRYPFSQWKNQGNADLFS